MLVVYRQDKKNVRRERSVSTILERICFYSGTNSEHKNAMSSQEIKTIQKLYNLNVHVQQILNMNYYQPHHYPSI